MVENFAFDFIRNKIHERDGDVSILLIDNDLVSAASLTLMLESFSYKVMTVDMASKAISMIEKQKDIKFVIANIEIPHIDSHSFQNSLSTKDISLILICPKVNTEKSSNSLTKKACYFLKKPISEKDITNMLMHVLPKKSHELEKICISKNKKGAMEEYIKQTETSRETLKRQITSQTSFLGRRPFMTTFTAYGTYQEKRNVANDDWKFNLLCSVEAENKSKKGKRMVSNVGRRRTLWNYERHMKFLSAVSTLGDNGSRPKSILRIMDDPNLTSRQVASYLQKYKAQVDRMYNTSNEAKVIAKKPIKEKDTMKLKFYLGGILDLSNLSFFGNISNNSSNMTKITLPQTNINHTCNSSFGESYVLPQEMVSYETNTTHVGLFSGGLNCGSYSQTNMTTFGTSMKDISQVQHDEDHNIPIEDMISFDNDVNEMDMESLFGNHGSSEINILSNIHIGHEVYNTPIEGGDDFYDNSEFMDWIDNVNNEDV